MSKIAVLGNCQAAGFAASLRTWMPDATVQAKSEANLSVDGAEKNSAFVDFLAECDVIFLQEMFRSKYLSPDLIDKIAGETRTTLYPRIIHTGFHPDCIYVHKGNQYVRTPMGQYNSALGLAGFLEGLSVQRTAGLFNKYSFAKLNYLTSRRKADVIFGKRLADLGYAMAPFADRSFMHTINHPKIEVLHSLAQQAIDKAGLDRLQSADCPTDNLAATFIWPIYAALPEGESYVFQRQAAFEGDRSLTLEDFLAGSFKAYAATDMIPAAALAETARAFIRQHVIP
jgi:Polysaccharide biosynthesis enzyme WcbI